MATEYQLSYTAQEIDERLGKVSTLETELDNVKSSANEEIGNIKESLSNAPVWDEGNVDLEERFLNNAGAVELVGYGNNKVYLSAETPITDGYIEKGVIAFYDSVYDSPVVLRNLADGERDNDAVTVRQMNNAVGDIESALDGIIEIQNSLIGGGIE